MNGKPCTFKTEGTILEVELPEKIAPLSKVVFECEFDGQVPIQIRRSGRNSKEGVDYSMAQWYPKLCEFDEQGWHANPYVAREFYGIWGDFDVTIHINKKFTLGGTGILQNPSEIGKGYTADKTPPSVKTDKNDKLAWHFKAKATPYREVQKAIKENKPVSFFEKKYKQALSKLHSDLRSQKDFQKIMGEIEVYGEVLIQVKNNKSY